MKLPGWITSIAGQCVAVTGACWVSQAVLQRMVRHLGGKTTSRGRVSAETTILVRGESSAWAHGDFGLKEQRVADLLREGKKISVVRDTQFRKLVEGRSRARVSDIVAGQPVNWLVPPTRREFEKVAEIPGPLDREHTSKGRLEQGFLRKQLLGSRVNSTCSICGRDLPTGLLIAAHVKPRSECTRAERLDVPHIVFPVCLLGCDALYERGFISVSEERKVILTAVGNLQAQLKKTLKALKGRRCSAWSEDREKYFSWHRRYRLQT